MKDIKSIIDDCLSYDEEQEWFEFKENWFEKDELGEYISAMSNSAAILDRDYAYLIWGINDKTHEIIGTKFNQNKEINNEPLQHYLARNLSPSLAFYFVEMNINKKRVVVLAIPSARIVPTSYKDVRYIRIGSSKENIKKYPEREAYLFSVLTFGHSTINNKESEYQDLTFNQLKTYYVSKGLKVNDDSFYSNCHLLTKDNKFNIMAQLLSDNSHIPVRVGIFSGTTKASKMYSVKEFGFKCLLYSLQDVLSYGEVLNIPQADETNRIMTRKEVMLFNYDAFREAVINAFLHNDWINLNEPMITFYSNRVEIMSHGGLAPLQTIKGFYSGRSIPVNDKLSELFLQLRISEKTGRGVPIIVDAYSKKSIVIKDDTVTVKIPFNKLNQTMDKAVDKNGKNLSASQTKVLAEIRNNPNITKLQLCNKCSLGKTSIDNIIAYLKKNDYIERIGSKKVGYWNVKI